VVDINQDGEVDPALPDFPPTLVSFDLVGGPYQATINHDRVQVMPGWVDAWHDLAIIELEQPVPSAIPRYPLYGLQGEVRRSAVFAGYGLTGHGGSGAVESLEISKRAGLNRIEATSEEIDEQLVSMPPNVGPMLVTDFDSGLAANNALQTYLAIASDLGFGADEVIPTSGDSGGPVFIDGVIVGVSSFGSGGFATDITPEPDSSWGELGFHTRVSSFQEFITTATDGQAVFVPEPASWSMLGLGTIAIVIAACHARATASVAAFVNAGIPQSGSTSKPRVDRTSERTLGERTNDQLEPQRGSTRRIVQPRWGCLENITLRNPG
jgi:hypothetical protein